MTIESSPAPTGARTSAAESQHVKGNSTSGGGGLGGDFMAILASMEPAADAEKATTVADLSLPAGLVAGATVATTVALSGTEAVERPNGLAELARFVDGLTNREMLGFGVDGDGENTGTSVADTEDRGLNVTELLSTTATSAVPDLTQAMLAATSMDTMSALVASAAAERLAALRTAMTADSQAELLATAISKGPMDTLSELRSKGQSALPVQSSPATPLVSDGNLKPSGAEPAVAAMNRPTLLTKLNEATTVLAPLLPPGGESGGKTGKIQRDLALKEALSGATTAELSTSSIQPEPRSVSTLAKLAEQSLVQVPALSAAAGAFAPIRREEVAKERSVFRSNAVDVNSAGQPVGSTSASASAQYTAEIPTFNEQQIAEKVAYWISNDVQSAELKLDGIGMDPVEVTIRMQGNEAHVAFRTDELQARTALENAGVHLKDLLMREGLVLSGVSVGTAGTGDSNAQDRKQRQGVRQGMVASVVPAMSERSSSPARVAGSALDLFV